MACDGQTYIPNPPRLWNRVQLPCYSYNLSPAEYEKYLMMKKGNVLQYKKNSSSLTKKQIYSLIAQGKWTNGNTTWATQNERGYTNPNTKMLKRNNSTNIIISGPTIVETTLPITCPSDPTTTNEVIPENIPSEEGENEGPNPELPPVDPEIGDEGTVLPSTPNEDTADEPVVVSDSGTLICNIIENPCTSYSKSKQANQFYHPTSDSNVPGKIKLLYWNENTQTWYPRQQRVMNTSNNKWPTTSGPPSDPTYIAATGYNK
jgi:hypothetical protein